VETGKRFAGSASSQKFRGDLRRAQHSERTDFPIRTHPSPPSQVRRHQALVAPGPNRGFIYKAQGYEEAGTAKTVDEVFVGVPRIRSWWTGTPCRPICAT